MGDARPGRVAGYQAAGRHWTHWVVVDVGVDAFVLHGTFKPGRGVAGVGWLEMNGSKVVERIARALAGAGSRRGVLGAGLAALAGAAGAENGAAKRTRCRAGRTRCGKKCRNLRTDRKACGRCGVRCGAGERCDAGRCCPNGQTNCGGWCSATCEGNAPRRPFPQRTGGIVPYPGAVHAVTVRTQAQQDDDVRAAYDRWKGRYLVRQVVRGEVRYWVRHGKRKHEQGWDKETVSEGMGYGMILAAHMAGYDPRAREIFDGLWRFARAYPSDIDRRLMQWKVRPGGKDLSNDSAFDGDCDMAYALLLAEAQWGNDGAIHYRQAFDRLVAGIEAATIGPQSAYPLLGDWVKPNGWNAGDPYTQWTARTSDFMPGHFRAFRRATQRAVWDRALNATQDVVDALQANHSPETGLLPDFVQPVSGANTDPRPAAPRFLESDHDGHYYYNAGRVPWRLGTDALLNGDSRSRAQALKMTAWARGVTGGDPQRLRAGYTLAGAPVTGGDYFTSFFAAPFAVAAMLDPDGDDWLDAVYGVVRARVEDYYEDTVALLCLLVMTGNFWDPAG